ncbi:MAG: DUF308 domain-containing protein [Candidatus Homeothermus sp.]|jgi:hypothetical protein|nr:DUF308 domain-containing protein [Candidatus Homeothermus sp.]PWL61918.1 MAG: hypothetical protein DBY35_04175 [Bacteroidales bacterium]
MNLTKFNFLGFSKSWWLVLIAGIVMIICGFAYWFWPDAGYAIASQIFGWVLILVGVVQLIVAAGPRYPKGWGWWIAGGMIDMFVGFLLVRSIILSEFVFPYFLALIFLYWGISMIIGSCSGHKGKYWWLYLVNGILLMLIGFFFLEAGWVQNMMMVSFLTSLAFIYWGFSICMVAYDIKPNGEIDE